MHKIVIGIDQSYKRTGITVMQNKELVKMFYIDGSSMSHASFRRKLRSELSMTLADFKTKVSFFPYSCIIMERIRLISNGNLSQNYIQETGALCGSIIEVGEAYGIPVFSVDTRAWKSAIVGTSKPKENKYGLPSEKYPTILYVKKKGLLKEIVEPYEGRAKKGIITIREGGHKYRARVLDDVADSYCIAEYGFLPEEKQKLKREDF